MAIALVQKNGIYPGTSKAFNSNNTGGNFLFAEASWTGGNGTAVPSATPTILDTNGNTWIPLAINKTGYPFNTHVSVAMQLFYCERCKPGPNTVSLGNLGSVDTDWGLEIAEYSGVMLSGSIDGGQVTTQSTSTTSATQTSSTITTTGPADLLILAYANEDATQGSFTAGTGFTLDQNVTNHADAQEHQLNVAAGSYNPQIKTSTATNDWILTAVAFQAAPAGTLWPAMGFAIVTASLHAKRRLTASTAVGAGTATATLIRWKPASVLAAGVGTASAQITKFSSGPSATVHAIASVTAAIQKWKGMAVAPAGAATASVVLNAIRSLTINASGSGTATATIGAIRRSQATAAGVGTATAAINAIRELTVAPAGGAQVTASINAIRRPTAQAGGVATVSAALAAIRRLTVLAQGAGMASATPLGFHVLTGSAAGTSTATATIHARRGGTATAGGTATVTVTLNVIRALTVAANGAGQASAFGTALRPGTASAGGSSMVTATLSRIRYANAQVGGLANTSATPNVVRSVAANSGGLANATAQLTKVGGQSNMTTTAQGGATVTAAIRRLQAGYQGKYRQQHDAALIEEANATGFQPQHDTARAIVEDAGV